MKNISFKLIFRSWWRNKAFTVISILSLAVGIACTNLLVAFVIHEYNIDVNNPNKDRIVAVKRTVLGEGSVNGYTSLLMLRPDVSDQLPAHLPELDVSCKVAHLSNATYLQAGENFYSDFKLLEADSTFFRFFPQKVVMGSLEDALVGPDRLVLSESFAKRLFGRNDPIGQAVQISFATYPLFSKEGLFTYTVSAVVKDDDQAAISFDALYMGQQTTSIHFFLLKDNVSIADLQAKTADLLLKNTRDEEWQYNFIGIQEACLKPLPDSMSVIKEPNTTLLFIALFSAILILAIACFNYVNLSFSRVFKQLYSMHVQKMMGAGSKQLSMQLFVDTFMTVGMGFLIAQLIQYDLLGVMNRIMSVHVSASFLYSGQMLPVTFLFILVLACIPAFYMSHRLPEMSISTYNNFYRGKARRRIVTFLAVIQFVISFVLIIGSFTVQQQLSLLYDKIDVYKDVFIFSVGDGKTSMLSLKDRVELLPGIEAVSVTETQNGTYGMFENESGKYERISRDEGDGGVMDVMGYKLIQGLPWKEAIELYPNPAYLNRTWAESTFPDGSVPIGHLIKDCEPDMELYTLGEHVIAGVIEDYFYYQLESDIHKSLVHFSRDGIYLRVRLLPGGSSETIPLIYGAWNQLYPGQYLEHESVYSNMLEWNKKVIEMSDLLIMYSIISILLTCFGLFGMTLYAIEQRTKEIGIRKVNGSTTWQIMMMLNRQFIGWIGIAYVIAVPVAWLVLNRWMQGFVHRADFSIWTYILPLVIVIAVTLLTVSWHSYRAASGNPVNALRDE